MNLSATATQWRKKGESLGIAPSFFGCAGMRNPLLELVEEPLSLERVTQTASSHEEVPFATLAEHDVSTTTSLPDSEHPFFGSRGLARMLSLDRTCADHVRLQLT